MNPSYPSIVKKIRQKYDEAEVLRKIMVQLAEEMEVFQSFQTCLSIGTGYGDYDIEFIVRCLPNLKKLIVVEKNHDCVEELKINLKNSFGNKLDVEIHEESIKSYVDKRKNLRTSSDNFVDIVIAFHVLHLMMPEDLLELLHFCFDSCLQSNSGLFLYAAVTEDNVFFRIHEQLRPFVRPFIGSNDVKKMVEGAGLKIQKEVLYKSHVDLNLYEDGIGNLFGALIGASLTKNFMEEAIKNAVPSGTGAFEAVLCIVSR